MESSGRRGIRTRPGLPTGAAGRWARFPLCRSWRRLAITLGRQTVGVPAVLAGARTTLSLFRSFGAPLPNAAGSVFGTHELTTRR